MMEAAYVSRATISDIDKGMEIVVPAQRSAAALVSPVALLGLLGLSCYAIFFSNDPQMSLKQVGGDLMAAVFGIVSLGFLCSLYQFWWGVKGSEVITVTGGVLTIEKKHTLEKAVSYDLASAGSFRSVRDVLATGRGQGWVNGYPWQIAIHGTVKFDYGVDTIQFGDWLSEAEGNYIIERLKGKGLIG